MTDDRCDIWICQDCLMFHANGEEPQMTSDEADEWLARIEQNTKGYEVSLGRVYGGDGCECVTAITSLMESIAETMATVTEMIGAPHPDWDTIIGRLNYETGDWRNTANVVAEDMQHEDTCEYIGFSSNTCGMCGSNVAGSRNAATLTPR
jgi:hypothetical protein